MGSLSLSLVMVSEGGLIKPVEICGCSNWEGEPPHIPVSARVTFCEHGSQLLIENYVQ